MVKQCNYYQPVGGGGDRGQGVCVGALPEQSGGGVQPPSQNPNPI